MKIITIKCDDFDANEIVRHLMEGEETGELDFSFEMRVEDAHENARRLIREVTDRA